jgi:hypothetical protein
MAVSGDLRLIDGGKLPILASIVCAKVAMTDPAWAATVDGAAEVGHRLAAVSGGPW